MSLPPGEYPDREAAALARRLEQQSQAAYRRFLALLDEGRSPQAAIREVLATFEGAYYTALAAAFSTALAERWTPAAMRRYPVGEVTLSARVYEHRRQTQAAVTAILREHAQGLHQARALALKLYEGYGFRAEEPLKVAEGHFRTLPKALRTLATEPAVRTTLMQAARRSAAIQLRTRALRSAYMQTFDAALAGASRKRLERLLQVAIYEKSRYFANRIAQTELGQAYSKRRAAEIMADDTIEVVQWRLSGAHPVEDVCDLFARVDRYGLGPGCYPKRRAPRPLAHPFCLCRLRTRPDLRAADARARTDAEREFLTALPEQQAARLMGSRARLKRVLSGQDARAVWNRGREPGHQVATLRETLPPSPPAAYEVAAKGGLNSGMLENARELMGPIQVAKGIRSYNRQIAAHEAWIKNPMLKLDTPLPPGRVAYYVESKWPGDIRRLSDERDVLIGLQMEKES